MADQAPSGPGPNDVMVADPSGDLSYIDKSEMGKAITQHGYRMATPDEINSVSLHDKYGGWKQGALALAESALALPTFGVSREIENATGLTTPEAQAGRASEHPIASGAGTALGLIPGFFTGADETEGAVAAGEGALGALKDFNPMAAMSKVAKVAGEGVAPISEAAARAIVPEASYPILNRAISQIAPAAVTSATEGAAYGLGQSISEHAMGDPDAIGEKLVANVGLGAVLGGSLGAGIKAAEIGVPEAVSGARKALDKIFTGGSDDDVGLATKAYSKVSSLVTGKPAGDIEEVIKNRALSLQTPEERTQMVEDLKDNVQEVVDGVKKASIKASKQFKPEVVDELLSGVDPKPAQQTVEYIGNKLTELKEQLESVPSVYRSSYAGAVAQAEEDFQRLIPKKMDAADAFKALDNFKSEAIDPISKFGKTTSVQDDAAVKAVRAFRKDLQQTLEREDVWGEMGAAQAKFNESSHALQTLTGDKGEFTKAFMKKVVTRGGGFGFEVNSQKLETLMNQIRDAKGADKLQLLVDTMKQASSHLDAIQELAEKAPNVKFDKQSLASVLSKNSELTNKVMAQAKYNKIASSLGSHASPYLEGGAVAAGLSHPAMGTALEAFNMLRSPALAARRLAQIEASTSSVTGLLNRSVKKIFSPIESAPVGAIATHMMPTDAAAHDKQAEKLNDYSSNPEKMIETMKNSTDHIYPYAPQTTASVHATAARGVSFLSSKLPRAVTTLPLSPKYKPSHAEISQFNQYAQVVNKPMSVLTQIKQGSLTEQSMEALTTVYPKLYDEMKNTLIDHLSQHLGRGKELNYSTKLNLSLFLGQDLDDSMTASSIIGNQMTMSQQLASTQQSQMQASKKKEQQGKSQFNQSGRMMTEMDQSADRRNT